MKRLLLLCILSVFSTGFVSAQPITLVQSNYAAVQPGTFLSWNIINTAGISAPERGEDMIWDYSFAQSAGFFTTEYTIPNNSGFPTATVAQPILYSLAGFTVAGESYEETNQQGHYSLGQSLEAATVEIDLGLGTGTLDVPAQLSPLYRKEMIFPATYGSTWNTPDSRQVVRANLTALIYQNTPSELVQHYIVHDSIIGWGTLILPGQQSYEVLLKKRSMVQIDSFYIGGQPALKALLDQLDLTQGDTTLTDLYTFHAVGIEGEVFAYSKTTSQGTTGDFAYYNSNLPTAVTEESLPTASSRLYPNPVTGDGTVVEFDKTSDAPWYVNVSNTLGETVLTIPVTGQTGRIHLPLSLSPALANGAYFYTIQNDRGIRTGNGTIFLSR